MKRKKKSRKIVGALLALTMSISSMGAPVSAMGIEHVTDESSVEKQNPEMVSETEKNVSNQSVQTKTILRFRDLKKEIAVQNVMQGITQEELNLPKTLKAKDVANNQITVPVVWEAKPSFNGNEAGEYLFLPALGEGYEVAEGEKLPQIHVTVTEERPAPSNIPENMEEESKTAEKSESVKLDGLQLLGEGEGETGSNVTVGLSGAASFSVATTLGGSADTVWLGYRFTLPESSPSGGTYEFDTGSYSWLSGLDGGLPVVRKEEGKLILEGKVEAKANSGAVAPGIYEPSIIVRVKNLVSNEKATLQAECWLVENGEQKMNATATITAQGSSEYSAMLDYGNSAVISGYFNQETGDFSISKPQDDQDYVYGRVYSIIPRAWADEKTERLDPTKPLEFDFSYYVTKTEGGEEAREEDTEYQPILMGIKRDDNEVTKSQLEGTPPIKGFTLGDLIADESGQNGPQNVGFHHGGDYTFKEEEKGTVHISAVLSKENKDSRYRHVSTYGLVFVPLNQDDADTVKRKLHFEIDNMKGTSYSGKPIQVKEQPVEKVTTVPAKAKEPEGGLFSRENYANHSIVKKGSTVTNTCIVINRDVGAIADYQINAINILMKFESGLELTKSAYEIDKSISKNYSGDVHFLYGLKPDKTGWTDERELNQTEDDDLVYYDDYNTAKENGEIVAVLAEFRGGIWKSGQRMMFRGEFEAVGNSGSSAVIVQDIKIWRGDKTYTTSWVGTNGNPVSQDTEPNDDMFPYDNLGNDTGVYRRDEWPEGSATPEAVEGGTWGETVFILGGAVRSLKKESVNLNGMNISTAHGPISLDWSNSTFDTSLNQRTVDRVFWFEVEDSEGKELTFRANLDGTENGLGEDCVKQTGPVYLSTSENPVTYTKNANGTQQGTFTGGEIIDPENFTVSGDGKYAIYYSGYIGSAENLTDDALAGTYWNITNLELIGDTPHYVVAESRVRNYYATTVTRTSSESADMISTSEAVVNTAGYVFSMTSEKREIENIFMLDVLPYKGDERGSNFNGNYTLLNNKVKIAYQNGEGKAPVSDVKVYYTKDEGIRAAADGACATAAIFEGSDCSNLENSFEAGGVTWSLATVGEDQTWTLPDGTRPTAIVVCGTIGENERIRASLDLALTGQKVGDTYYNLTSNLFGEIKTPVTSETAMVKVMGRNLSGKVWEDMDRSGTFNGNDKVLENVEVQLFDANGKQIIEDAAKVPYKKVVTGADGSYLFENVPESVDGYYVQFSGSTGTSLTDYQTIAPNSTGVPYDKADDSDVEFQTNPQAVVKTDTFKLLTNKELAVGPIVQRAEGVNAGFEKLAVIHAEKRWNGQADSETQVSVQLQRKGETSSWEKFGDPIALNDANSWKTFFENQLVFYSEVGRYQYRIVELDENGIVVGDEKDITLNNNQYRVDYEETEKNKWKITNSRLVDLAIENEVAGEFGDQTKEFTIDITAKDSKGKPLSGEFVCESLEGTDKITFDGEGKGQISLAHEDKLLIKDLPAETNVVVAVQSPDDYDTTYQINDGTAQDKAELLLTRKENVVKVINKKDYIPETGIFHNPTITGILIFVGIIGIAYVGIVILRKRRGIR